MPRGKDGVNRNYELNYSSLFKKDKMRCSAAKKFNKAAIRREARFEEPQQGLWGLHSLNSSKE